jgi:hypothetical protein
VPGRFCFLSGPVPAGGHHAIHRELRLRDRIILVPPLPSGPAPVLQQRAEPAQPEPAAHPVEEELSDEYLTRALQDLWSGQGEDLMEIRVGRDRGSMQRQLLAALPRRPEAVQTVHSPARERSGLYTLQVTEADGRQAMIGLRLLRHLREKPGWEVESLVVLSPVR